MTARPLGVQVVSREVRTKTLKMVRMSASPTLSQLPHYGQSLSRTGQVIGEKIHSDELSLVLYP
jgi:hypothetical protein